MITRDKTIDDVSQCESISDVNEECTFISEDVEIQSNTFGIPMFYDNKIISCNKKHHIFMILRSCHRMKET